MGRNYTMPVQEKFQTLSSNHKQFDISSWSASLWLVEMHKKNIALTDSCIIAQELPYSREQKHVSISDTPMLLIEINSISNMGCQK